MAFRSNAWWDAPQGQSIWPFPQVSYSIRIPEIARAMTSCWICSVPSKMS